MPDPTGCTECGDPNDCKSCRLCDACLRIPPPPGYIRDCGYTQVNHWFRLTGWVPIVVTAFSLRDPDA